MALLRCKRCDEQFESAALKDGQCHLCLELPPEEPVFESSPRTLRPCRNCAGHSFWRRSSINMVGDHLEQFICKNCGYLESYLRNVDQLREGEYCQSLELDESGPFR